MPRTPAAATAAVASVRAPGALGEGDQGAPREHEQQDGGECRQQQALRKPAGGPPERERRAQRQQRAGRGGGQGAARIGCDRGAQQPRRSQHRERCGQAETGQPPDRLERLAVGGDQEDRGERAGGSRERERHGERHRRREVGGGERITGPRAGSATRRSRPAT